MQQYYKAKKPNDEFHLNVLLFLFLKTNLRLKGKTTKAKKLAEALLMFLRTNEKENENFKIIFAKEGTDKEDHIPIVWSRLSQEHESIEQLLKWATAYAVLRTFCCGKIILY